MKRTILFLLPILALILSACSGTAAKTATVPDNANASSAERTTNPFERSDNQGAVTVTITPINLENPGETLNFNVSLQTHSVDLSMDVASLSTLITDTGVSAKGISWDGAKGGHHVTGKLSFPASQDGKPVLQGAKTVTITIQNIDASERTFTWDITK